VTGADVVTLEQPVRSAPKVRRAAAKSTTPSIVTLPQRSARRELIPVVVVAVVLGAAASAWSAATHSMVLYGDARAHLDVARHVTDGLTVGLAQLGSVWLPLPHILLVPLVAITPLWHSGAAGAILSGICFVYTSVRMYTLVNEVTGSRIGAWVAFAVFATNLNMLYVQTTALTEPVLLAMLVGAVFHLARWMRTMSAGELMLAGVMTALATLSRYEGWALLAAGVVAVGIWSWRRHLRSKASQANLIVYTVTGAYGVLLWFLYNLIIFHDPLYFLHSAYSAQAINGAQAKYGLLGTKGSLGTSIITYGWDMVGVVGAVVLVTGAVACAALLLAPHRERLRTALVLMLLAAPVAFEIATLYIGQITIRVPQLAPHEMWNDRYGLLALPLCAFAIGTVVGRWPRLVPVAAIAVVVGVTLMGLGTPLTLADGRSGVSSATAGRPQLIAGYLRTHYRGGEILADDSAASSVMFASYLDLKEFVSPGFHPFWEEALADPSDHVEWVLAFPGDAVTTDLRTHPGRFSDFTPVLTQSNATLYRRKP
jgi:hypothetical protein